MAKEFDTISHKSVLDKLETFGSRGPCHDLFKSHLENRSQVVKIDKLISELKTLLHGLPQGTVLAPMFIMDLNDMHALSDIISFVDETALLETQIQDIVKKN